MEKRCREVGAEYSRNPCCLRAGVPGFGEEDGQRSRQTDRPKCRQTDRQTRRETEGEGDLWVCADGEFLTLALLGCIDESPTDPALGGAGCCCGLGVVCESGCGGVCVCAPGAVAAVALARVLLGGTSHP